MAQFIAVVVVILWLATLLKNCDTTTPIPPPPNLPQAPTLSLALSLLNLARFWGINQANASVTVPPGVEFKPVEFVQKHQLQNPQDVRNFDQQAQHILTSCIRMELNTRNQNHISTLRGISSCLHTNGYDNNDEAYMHGKFPNTMNL
jgi:hypothetical protein